MKFPLSIPILTFFLPLPAATPATIDWDPATIRLLHPGATYGRIHRLAGGPILCSFEKSGRSWVMRSEDNADSWSAPLQVADFPAGTAANPDLCPLRDGRVLLFWNERPHQDGGPHRFTIRMAASHDGGRSWQPRATPVFTAGNTRQTACWEPAALETPDGTLRLFFSRELENGQEITTMLSHNSGQSWSAPRRASFRPDHRDGMAAPILLASGRTLFSIEDNGLGGSDSKRFRPAIVDADSGKRWPALAANPPPDAILAAPYLARLPAGDTLLSVQHSPDDAGRKRMAVFTGGPDATSFGNPSFPFADRPQRDCLWNSLFVPDPNRVIALANTRIDGRSGLWSVTGRVVRESEKATNPD